METIIDLIINEFQKAGYRIIAVNDDIFLKHKEYGDFWIIHYCYDFDLKEQEDIYNRSKETLPEYKEADKNTSLLIVMNTRQADDTLRKRIVDIENDPFLFKKYVLVYNDKELGNLQKVIAGKEISKLIMERDVFQKLKDESVQDGIGCYHLLYSLAHKLPFMMADVKPMDSDGLINTYQAKDDNDAMAYEWLKNIEDPKDADKLEELIITEISNEQKI